mgnify:CR=1 FL=1
MRTRTRGSPSWRGPMCHYAGYVCARPTNAIRYRLANGAGHTFLNVHPRPRSQAPSALRLIFTCRSTDKSSTISSSVTSLRSSIRPTTNASCASSTDGRLQPCGRAVGSPSFALAIQRIAVEIPTPNLAAACRADMPAADAFTTRNRRSSLNACAIIHLLAVDVESASAQPVTSQSIHRSQDLLVL